MVTFLDSLDKVHSVVQGEVVIHDTLISVMPLTQPARKIILSNVPPFIKDELLIAELSRYGKMKRYHLVANWLCLNMWSLLGDKYI